MTKNAVALGIFTLVIAGTPALAQRQIHKWKDADGVVHFTDTPPPPSATVLDGPSEDKGASPTREDTQRGLTWGALKKEGLPPGTVDVGCHGGPKVDQRYAHQGSCNPYHGDTSCAVRLPLLCFKSDDTPPPPGVAQQDFYNGWSGGHAALTAPTAGTRLTSAERGDALCSAALGAGWRMAEFHDGRGGWGFIANGQINGGSRFWVRINDQPGNCWNSAAANENSAPAQPKRPAGSTPSQPSVRREDRTAANPGA